MQFCLQKVPSIANIASRLVHNLFSFFLYSKLGIKKKRSSGPEKGSEFHCPIAKVMSKKKVDCIW